MQLTVDQAQGRIDNWLSRTSQTGRLAAIVAAQEYFKFHFMHNGGVPIDYLTLPYFISRTQHSTMQHVLHALILAHARMEEVAFADRSGPMFQWLYRAAGPEGRRHLELPDWEPEGASIRRYQRMDGVFDANGHYQIFELNKVGPQGFIRDALQELVYQLMLRMGFDLPEPDYIYDGILRWLVDEYRRRYNTTELPKRIAVVEEPSYAAIMSAIPSAADLMAERSEQLFGQHIKMVHCHQGNIRVKNGQLCAYGKPVNMIWRNAARLDAHRPHSRPQIPHWNDVIANPRRFIVVNGEVRPRLTRTKGSLTVFSDPELLALLGLPDEVVRLVQHHLPETYHLGLQPWSHARILKDWRDWVFKPSDDGLGRGVLFGHNMTRGEVATFLGSGAAGDYVAQRRVRQPRVTLPTLSTSDGSIVYFEMEPDMCLNSVGGTIGDQILSRSADFSSPDDGPKLHNVSQGGRAMAVVPTLL